VILATVYTSTANITVEKCDYRMSEITVTRTQITERQLETKGAAMQNHSLSFLSSSSIQHIQWYWGNETDLDWLTARHIWCVKETGHCVPHASGQQVRTVQATNLAPPVRKAVAWLANSVPDMTYNVFVGTLNLTQSNPVLSVMAGKYFPMRTSASKMLWIWLAITEHKTRTLPGLPS